MIICPNCGIPLIQKDNGFICQKCGCTFPDENGILKIVSTAQYKECFFPKNAFKRLYESEERNFWFKVRNTIISNTILSFISSGSRILEVGCGTGFVSQQLKKLGYHIECGDLFLDALRFCKLRNAGEYYYQFNLMDRVFLEEFSGICAFDVLEHIEDDETVLKNLHASLKPEGILIMTVPADMRLWSERDIQAEHIRRYSKNEIQAKLKRNGFNIERISYFMTLLYPVLFLFRKVSLRKREINVEQSTEMMEKEAMNELQPNKILNFMLYYIFMLEALILRVVNLPFGSSLLCVASKEPLFCGFYSSNEERG